ncbi:MAG: hypothetical protein R3C32_06065 [Chloroflexota bacterium]
MCGRFLLRQGMIPVRAGRSDVDALRQARSVLERGGVIVVFPEGTAQPRRRHRGGVRGCGHVLAARPDA